MTVVFFNFYDGAKTRSRQLFPRFARIFLAGPYAFFGPITQDAYSPHTGLFSYGFPTKMRAQPYGSYDESKNPTLRECSVEKKVQEMHEL